MEETMNKKISPNNLTIQQMADLGSGADFWNTKAIASLNIPAILLTDGPHGLRKQNNPSDHIGILNSVVATCFPPAVTSACSWDIELLEKMGKAIAHECIAEKVDVLLGPGVNIKRSPLCGRNFEYFSEDPFLSGKMAAAFIRGVQSLNIGTSLKHFAGNSQEYYRMITDSMIDLRTLHEIYLTAFEIAIKEAQPWTVMAAYNKVNGVYCSENPYLLQDVLRKKWQFEGAVITDWGACNQRVHSIMAGCNLEMPGDSFENNQDVKDAILAGDCSIESLHKSTQNLLQLIEKCQTDKENINLNFEHQHEIAQLVAEESMVLLKNSEHILPLNPALKLCVIGELALYPRFQGAGSSMVNPSKSPSFIDILTQQNQTFTFSNGYSIENDLPDPAKVRQAIIDAKSADCILCFVGLTDKYESEGFDREHIELPLAHNDLIFQLIQTEKPIIVILAGGSAVTMPWVDQVNAVLHSLLPGQAGTSAIWRILTGEVNPSGKLAETYALSLHDYPSTPFFAQNKHRVEYRENLYVGYRYFATKNQTVLFPFGFGLSYTTFSYQQLQIINNHDATWTVQVDITNDGSVFGKEVVQLYISKETPIIHRPKVELKGFYKVALLPKQTKTITFTLNQRSFAYYHSELDGWVVEPGKFYVHIGASCIDLRLSKSIDFAHPETPVPYNQTNVAIPNVYQTCFEKMTDEEFYQLLGYQPTLEKTKRLGLNHSIEECSVTFGGKILRKILRAQARKLIPMDKDEKSQRMFETGLMQSPLRSLVLMSNGALKRKTALLLLKIMNIEYALFHHRKT